MNVVNPSFSHRFDQSLQVTKLPVHECAISCVATYIYDPSGTMIVGDANVSSGFSIPPTGKDGGSTRIV